MHAFLPFLQSQHQLTIAACVTDDQWIGTFIGGRYVTKYVRRIPDSLLRNVLIFIAVVYLTYLVSSLI